MRIAIAVVSVVFLLSVIRNVELKPTVYCLPDDIINVVLNKTEYPALVDYYVTVVNTDQCNSTQNVQLTDVTGSSDIQAANLTCFNLTIDESFPLALVKNNTIQSTDDGIVTYNVTCVIPDNFTEYFNVSVTARPSTATFDAFYEPNVTTSINKPFAAVQESVSITVELDAISFVDVVLTIIDVTYRVVGTDLEIYLVSDRCPNTTYVSGQSLTGTPNGAPASKIVFSFDAFILNIDQTRTNIIAELSLLIGFCSKAKTGFCFGAGGCDGPSDKIGRKRRQAEDEEVLTKTVKKQLMLFPSKQQQKEYVYERMAEVGIPKTQKEEGEICVNKTVTAVLLSLLLIAMAICLISSVIMFLKLRKNREDKLVKSDHSYSNKGF